MGVLRPLPFAGLAGLALLASPVLAQEAPLPPLADDGSYDGSWSGTYIDPDGNAVEGDFRGHFVGQDRFVSDDGLVIDDPGDGHWREAREWRDDGPPEGDRGPEWRGPPGPMPMAPGPRGPMRPGMPPQPGPALGYRPEEREGWLAECRHRLGDNGVGGAVIGGVIGGVAGNRIAGRGHRVVGTVAGAAVGAAAGAAIDRAEDKDRVRDTCEAYLDRYEASYRSGYSGGAYPGGGYAYAYPAGQGQACSTGCGYPAMGMPMMWVPIMLPAQSCCCQPQAPKRRVRTIVTEEYVPEKVIYETVPTKVVRTKYIQTKIVRQTSIKQTKQTKSIK